MLFHYDGDGDEPSWIVNDATLPDNLTRYVEGMDGALAVQTGKTGERVLQLVDLHGDITATLPIADGATTATFTELRFTSFDEFGIPQPMTSGATSNAPPARYGWLGAAQRNADTPAGVILMGVRLYHPATGRFLSVDPVAGGSANNYDYCNADPVNCTDLGGTFTWKGLVKGIAKVGEVASWIPGPIGAAAGGISAVAYAASGNKGKALEMAVSAAAQMVGAGAGVRAGFKVASVAAKAGQKVRAATKTRRSCNSFAPGTQVRLANGELAPIETLDVGDALLAGDPKTGEIGTEVVIYPIKGYGEKHLIEIMIAGDSEPIVATANHPFWVASRGWVEAEEVAVGDELVGSDDGLSVVGDVRDLGLRTGQTVFNLHVSGPHTYFVTTLSGGETDRLVHNARGDKACELVVPGANSFEQARNKALSLIGPIDPATRTPHVGRLGIGMGKVVGFTTRVKGVVKTMRLDYDAKKGPHINVLIGRNPGRRYAVTFPGTKRTAERLLRRNT